MNRLLVERATHPDLLAEIQAELVARDPGWQTSLKSGPGQMASGKSSRPRSALLDRDMPLTT